MIMTGLKEWNMKIKTKNFTVKYIRKTRITQKAKITKMKIKMKIQRMKKIPMRMN